MPRSISALPPELTRVIFAAGDRRVVLVEGKEDKAAFDVWYSEKLSDIEFIDSGGASEVRALLPVALSQSIRKRIFGIIDRDWLEDIEAAAWKAEADPHLFILTRYDLENYLLEPAALHGEMSLLYNTLDPAVATPQDVEALLLNLCRQLCPILAANWIFYDSRLTVGVDYFDESYFPHDRAVVVRATSAKLSIAESDADNQIAAKEAAIQPYLLDLQTAHQRIKGKTLLFLFHRAHVKLRLPVLESFRNYMIRAVKLNGIHADIREIVDDRILQS